jgi:hypothetical protein
MWSWSSDAEIKNDWRSTSRPYSVTQKDDYQIVEYIIAIKVYLHIGFLGPDFKHYIFNLWMQFLHYLFCVTCLFKAVWKLTIINYNPANKKKFPYLPTTNKLQGENAYLLYHSVHVFDGTYASYKAIFLFSFSSTYHNLFLMIYKYKSWTVCCTYLFLNILTAQHMILAEIQFLKWYHEKLYQMVKLSR